MNKSDFPKEQLELMQAIYDMRAAQQKYFRRQNNYNLKVAKAKEAAVDKYLEFFIVNKLIDTLTVAKPVDVQANLFNS